MLNSSGRARCLHLRINPNREYLLKGGVNRPVLQMDMRVLIIYNPEEHKIIARHLAKHPVAKHPVAKLLVDSLKEKVPMER
jgi:hypothetical protein